MTGRSRVGEQVALDVDRVAHGGACVARLDGRAVFVRHALPGERVRARITEGGDGDRYWRADAIEILTPSPDRVAPPCRFAGPGGCGGCDWQHVSLPAQRRLKADVVAEQLRRLAGIDWGVVVEPMPGEVDGLGWRTRVSFAVDHGGRAGLRQHRSHAVVPVDRCLIAHPQLQDVTRRRPTWPAAGMVRAVASNTGQLLVSVSGGPDEPDHRRSGRGRRPAYATEQAAGRRWRVAGDGFWQVHPRAADTLVEAVVDAVAPRPGDRVFDLYCGVGLFAGAVAPLVGRDGHVLAVDDAPRAIADARVNLADLPQVELVVGTVPKVLARSGGPGRADVVVLDPPRSGAKAAVVGAIVERCPRVVAYVACDPAALARDLATFGASGYRLTSLRAFDAFPMTHHVECVATLRPTWSL